MQEWCFPFLYFPHAVSSCAFVGVIGAVTFCNYCCNRIGLLLNAKFCHDGAFLDANSRPVELPRMRSPAQGGGTIPLIGIGLRPHRRRDINRFDGIL